MPPVTPENATVVSLLLIGIAVLAGVVVALWIYIKKQIKNAEEKDAKRAEAMIDMATKFVEAVNLQTAAVNTVGEAINRHNVTINDLHKFIISQKK